MSGRGGLPVLRVGVPSPVGSLEGLFRPAPAPAGGALVCHPHPVYGGTMRDRVVVAIERGFVAAGLSTLRFNFRGTGRSPGRHDGGRGEGDDVRAALRFLDERAAQGPLVVAGYSFGCTVGLPVGAGHGRVGALMGVGVSFRFFPPPDLGHFDGSRLFVQGDRDELGPLAEVRPWVASLPGDARLITVPGADHFFAGPLVGAVRRAAEELAREVVGAANG